MRLKDLTRVTDDEGFKGTSRMWRLSILFSLIGLVVYIIGFSTNWWCELDGEDFPKDSPFPLGTVDAHFGLWRKCIKLTVFGNITRDGCEDQDNDDAWKPASKSLCSIGLIFAVFGLLAAVAAGSMLKSKLMGVAGVLLVLGAVVAAVGGAVFVGKAKDEDDRLEPEYSVFFALIGPALLILGGGLQLMSVKSAYTTIA